jgi:TRAP-type uncharacterized transport system substrate-binding protein
MRTLVGSLALFGRGPVWTVVILAVSVVLLALIALVWLNLAAPTTLTITTGPDGSTSRRTAEQYKALLAKQGVTLKIVPSSGSSDNLQRLSDPKSGVDVGFVLGGETSAATPANLVSLGSVSYQPLMVFYRGPTRALLSDFKGARIDIGPPGSGTSLLAQALLSANGVAPGDGTVFTATASDDTARALREGRIDAFFAMSESTSTDVIRQLLRTDGVHLFTFTQADGYSRRFPYLHKLTLPKGSLDFGEDIPAEDVQLIAPTVELVARDTLHPALSDVLLETAREVHARPGLFKTRGEFPAPLADEFRISPDATRYYASGKSYLYRTFPFWAASLIARVVAVVVPLVLLLIPAVRLMPVVYRWRMTSRIYRWYGALQRLERDAHASPIDAGRREEFAHRLDHIERAVQRIVVPPAFGDLFYVLRGHIHDVRRRLLGGTAAPVALGQSKAAADAHQE